MTQIMDSPKHSHALIPVPNQPGCFYNLENPVAIFRSSDPVEIPSILMEVSAVAQRRQCTAIGFVSYEASPAFDAAMQVKAVNDSDPPLIWFGLYKSCSIKPLHQAPWSLTKVWQPEISEDRYCARIREIRDHIASGVTYQVNYTYRQHGVIDGEPLGFFRDLVKKQSTDHCVFIDTGDYAICSVSPELFFDYRQDTLTMRPMKGTAKRDLTNAEEDAAIRHWLETSNKNRAENLMIVDMIRNDLGRIAIPGTVSVPRLFTVEPYPTVWQMTSTVCARTRADIPEIFNALFPCASITGAPKIETMRLIADLEDSSRGLYTGAIGCIHPTGDAWFNVAIRTAVIHKPTGKAEYGVGGGIVWDSTPEDEYQESRLKARVLWLNKLNGASLLTTLFWSPETGLALWDEHLTRLKNSMTYFGIPAPSVDLETTVTDKLKNAQSPQRIRLLIDETSLVTCECTPFTANTSDIVRIRLASDAIDSSNPLLYHKTTDRRVYNHAKEKDGRDVDDVLLWNEKGEITETTIANVVIEENKSLLTPALECGLLPGTLREKALKNGQITEAIITRERLLHADRLWLINSLRGWREAVLVETRL
jgi:para-aminobenzoate synthetase/4-amino-4-deoxychorismate lyase